MERKKPQKSCQAPPLTNSCWDGNYYASHSGWQFHIAMQALSILQIPMDSKLLDIGCGDGRITKYLASLVPSGEIIGLDPSLSMLAAAKNNQMPNLSFLHGDAENLPFQNQFDRIVAFNSLHWVSKIDIALRRIQNALIPGGQALIVVAPIQVRHVIHRVIDEVAGRKSWATYFDNKPSVFSFHTLAEWAIIIEKAGMIPERLQLIDASFAFANKKFFADWMTGWVPSGTIPVEKKEKYIHEIVETYTTVMPCKENGLVYYGMDELVIVASSHHSKNANAANKLSKTGTKTKKHSEP